MPTPDDIDPIQDAKHAGEASILAPLESWRLVWREGFAPILPQPGLEALAEALRSDDKTLMQGATTYPRPLSSTASMDCEAACAIAYCGWKGLQLRTVGDVEQFHAEALFNANEPFPMPAVCRWFIRWFDDTPRDEMRRELLGEVQRELARRATATEQGA